MLEKEQECLVELIVGLFVVKGTFQMVRIRTQPLAIDRSARKTAIHVPEP